MKVGGLILLIFFIALVFSIAAKSQANSEIEDFFEGNEEADVIVVLKEDYSALQEYGISDYRNEDNFEMKKMMVRAQQERVLGELKPKKKDAQEAQQSKEEYGIKIKNRYATVNGFAGKIKKSSYQKLKDSPRVLKIIKNGVKRFSLDASVPLVNATNVWRLVYSGVNVTGKGQSVCVIDSGIDYTHPSLGNCTTSSFIVGNCSKVIAGYDLKNNDSDPIDDQGHGTHVAGIIASTNATYRGVAPEAALVALKVCDNSLFGNCRDDDIISAIDWCVNNASIFNISVISMSLGSVQLFADYCDEQSSELPYKIAIDNAVARNISVVVATGNDESTSGIASPACIRNATAIGSSTKSDAISSFSNRNSITDLMAPGSSIRSTVPMGNCINCDSSGFATFSGTSMATPHASGVFALLQQYKRLEQNMTLTSAQIQDALNSTGRRIDDTSGSGFLFSRINVYAALLSLDLVPPKIIFVEPTPANNTKTSKNSLFINLTSNELTENILLDFNGTNESMEGSALNWFKNKTVPSNQNADYSYKVWGIDFSGNIGLSEFRLFISNNTPPNISFFAPSELSFGIIEGNSNFTFNVSVADLENDSLVISWYKNSTLAAINSNFTFQNNFSAAGFYNITLQVYDGNFTVIMIWNLTVNSTNQAVNITSFFPSDTNLNIPESVNQSFNATAVDFDNDNFTVTWFQNSSLKSTISNFTFTTNSTAAGFYNITFAASDGSAVASISWNLTVFNLPPNITSINLTNTDSENRTNGDIVGSWSFIDYDADDIVNNETRWYNKGTEIELLRNLTTISSGNTTKGDNWTFSVRAFDGFNWSGFVNSSAMAIQNSRTGLALTAVTNNVKETESAIINFTATDNDNDAINITINNQNFSKGVTTNTTNPEGILTLHSSFVWQTTLMDSGSYSITVSASDGQHGDDEQTEIMVFNARDLDNDGSADFNDNDDDNDGISDENDYLVGNLSAINSTMPINLTINGTSNLSQLFNGTYKIEITNGSYVLIEFNFTFDSLSILDLGNLTINRSANGSGAISIKGDINLFNSTKTVFLEKFNSTVKSVCAKDADASFDSISSGCDSVNETLVICDNSTSSQYSCFDTGSRYKVSGLRHSAVREQCIDADGDGYGAGCIAGQDCNDNDASKAISCSSGSSSSGGSSGGGGGSSGGGGGGGGGLFFVCNMDWKCGDWSACANGLQARQCEFVKVPQHASDIACPSQSNSPIASQKCEVPKQLLLPETCNDGVKNQDEQGIDCGGACKPCEQRDKSTSGNLNSTRDISSTVESQKVQGITGFASKEILGIKSSNIATGVIVLIVVSIFAGIKMYNYRMIKKFK